MERGKGYEGVTKITNVTEEGKQNISTKHITSYISPKIYE